MKPSNNIIPQFAKTTRHVLTALLLGGVLVSCGGGGGASNEVPAGSRVISGIVSDDAIAGATVTATSVDSGLVLGSATTATDGSYSLNAIITQIGTGYTLNSTGGTMNGQTFNGNLSAIYPAAANTQQSNLTLITSALATTANSTAQYSGTVLQKQEAIIKDAIARGVINPDYSLVDPSGTLMAALRNQAQLTGVSATTGAFAQILGVPPTLGDCGVLDTTCTKDVSHFGESLSMTFKGATVSAPAGALSSCRVIESFDENAQSMTVRFENIPSTTANSTPQFICQITGNVTLTLPSSTAPAPGECLLPGSGVASVPNCVTSYSGMIPSYFVDGGDGHNHRTDKNPHSSKPVFGGKGITFSRSYGAVLSASSTRSINVQNQWQGKTPVIFVHGFSKGGNFGGNDGTWGVLPQLLLEDPSYVALNFQWITDASYLTVASELAKAVDYAYLSTGKKVHIVAHSFGGVLSRAMLQNLNGTTGTAASHVATLTTVGTPHSGIVSVGAPFEVEGYFLPQGWGSWVPDSWCAQISCYQSGLNANLAQWAKDDLACPAGITACPAGSIPTRGYVNARLADLINHPLPAGLKVQVLIGQIIEKGVANNYIPTFKNDDGLISYYGQRFIPQSGRNPLLSGAGVTERILGLLPGVNAFPGDPVGNIAVTPYTYKPNYVSSDQAYTIGYKHSSDVSTLATGGVPTGVNSEVYVPANCGTASTCLHDTWLNIKEFLLANSAPTAPTGISTAIVGDGQAVIGWDTVAGVTYNLYMASVSGVTKSNFSSLTNGMQHVGVTSPYHHIGLTNGTTYYFVVTAVDANGESIESSQVSATPVAPAPPVTTSTLNDTGITASQCYQAGSDVLVACNSVGAIALNSAQDGMAGRDANAATNSNTDGKLGFSFTSVTGGCVQDSVTGLMWEKKTTDGGLRDWNKTYTNFSASYDPILQYGTSTDASGFVTAVNATNLCGYSDWRLPTADELQSIVDYSKGQYLTIDTNWFPDTKGDVYYSTATSYWTSSPSVGSPSGAWVVFFSDGTIGGNYRNHTIYVRLVRAGQLQTTPRYSVSTDGQEVTDNQTKLIWRRCSEGMVFSAGTCTGTASTFTHETALQLAAAQASSTGIVWRLPNVKELSSIADRNLSNPAIDPTAFPATPANSFWSASPYTGIPSIVWINSGGGLNQAWRDGRGGLLYVRLVRDGP